MYVFQWYYTQFLTFFHGFSKRFLTFFQKTCWLFKLAKTKPKQLSFFRQEDVKSQKNNAGDENAANARYSEPKGNRTGTTILPVGGRHNEPFNNEEGRQRAFL